MSWFNLNVNESLNTLKGQISNVSNVVHDALTEKTVEEGEPNENSGDGELVIGLETANKRIDELNSLCETKDTEIVKLRKQIEHLTSTSATQKSKPSSQHGAQQESELGDSWVWESEKSPSSVSSKENETLLANELSENADMTTISLVADEFETTANVSGAALTASGDNRRIVENLRRALDEKDAEIKQLVDENLELNGKMKQLYRDSIEQDKRLEELDQQHTVEIESVLGIKNELQAKIITLDAGLKASRDEQIEHNMKFEQLYRDHSGLLAANQELITRFDEIEARYQECSEENDRLRGEADEVHTQLASKSMEVVELNAMLEEKEAHSRDGSDKFEMIDKLSNSSEVNRLQTELDEINDKLAILNDIKDQYDENVAKLGSVVSENAKLEEQLSKVLATNDSLMEEIRVTRESVEKLEVLQKNLDEINMEKEQNEVAFVALQEDDLVLQRECDQLKADKEKLATELESTKSTQDEQIIALESKCVELEMIVNQVTSKHDTLKADHSNCHQQLDELQAINGTMHKQTLDLEARLTEANKYQAQVIDLQSALNSKNATTDTSSGAITLGELKVLLTQHLNYKSSDDSLKSYLDVFLGSVRDRYQHLADIETNRNDLMKQFECVSSEKATLQHEYRTLKADLHHYEAEVAELMKNNGILLNELENAKSGKLETISEQNEDNILRLETQLDDTNKLNRSLQDEYDNSLRQLEEHEEEKYELIEKVAALETQLKEKIVAITELQQQIGDAALAHTNMQLQLDQNDTNNLSSTIQKEFEEQTQQQQQQIGELTMQLEHLNIDHADLVHKLEAMQEDKQRLLCQLEALKSSNASENEIVAKLHGELNNANEKLLQLQMEKDEQCKQQLEQIDVLNCSLSELKVHIDKDEIDSSSLSELQQRFEKMTHEKQELINAIQLKHNENVQYHTKIQELNQMLIAAQQTIAAQHQQLAQCESCTLLNTKLAASHDELAKMTDQITFLKEKSDIMTKNLLIEQSNQKLIQQEKLQLQADKDTLTKDLMRLRQHLIEMEDGNTATMLELQNQLELTQQELTAMQEEARKSNTAYTSASIRANQHTETLQAQYAVLQQQKEDLSVKLSEAEDRESKNRAALINLQCVLEQFQKDKERDVEAITQRIRNELNDANVRRQGVNSEMEVLREQLEESKAGLLAAARISDQLEIAQVATATVKEELRNVQDKLHATEQKLHETESNQADRVDKSLLKNLLIGYIAAPNNDKSQILKLISSVLDFNQQESDKVGLNRSHSSWLNSIMHGNGNASTNRQENLVEAFVKFLENESQPRTNNNDAPPLLNISASSTSSDDNNRPAQAIQPILLPEAMLQTFNAPRNSSSILKDILNDS